MQPWFGWVHSGGVKRGITDVKHKRIVPCVEHVKEKSNTRDIAVGNNDKYLFIRTTPSILNYSSRYIVFSDLVHDFPMILRYLPGKF